jgi:hypothetical protein
MEFHHGLPVIALRVGRGAAIRRQMLEESPNPSVFPGRLSWG